jgi:regulator of protease activity HflC (stomatin/prohibitin superfamily)
VTPVLIAAPVLLAAWAVSGIRVVRPSERAVVTRFGRYRKSVGPGIRLALPFVHRLRRVDGRLRVADVRAECLTDDDIEVTIDVAVSYACVDARRFLYDVADPERAVARASERTLRNLVGLLALEALERDEHLSEELLRCLKELGEDWGVQISRVDVVRIELPTDVLAAMHQRAASERHRAALVVEAENEVRLAVARVEAECRAKRVQAEAEKDLLILEAEAEAEATRVLADAARYRQESVARAQAEAIRILSVAISGQAPELVAVKYLEALVPLGDAATPAGLPPLAELAALLQPLEPPMNGATEALSAPEPG